jgi:hypothetical protein
MNLSTAAMEKFTDPLNFSQRLWDAGQRLLAAGRYMAARRELESAEQQAWRQGDAVLLSRIYLPLLETCRQIRQQATDALIVIDNVANSSNRSKIISSMVDFGQGTLICYGAAARQTCHRMTLLARQRGLSVETLLLRQSSGKSRLYSEGARQFAAGLPVLWSRDFSNLIEPEIPEKLVVRFPPPGTYHPGEPGHALARESLLVAWEALAIRHIPSKITSESLWEQIRLLRDIRRIDPACEPVLLRLMALAEQIAQVA